MNKTVTRNEIKTRNTLNGHTMLNSFLEKDNET